jgi:cyclophilin family peptidyl-prolyl cis-trans isomerase/predicted secreted protein
MNIPRGISRFDFLLRSFAIGCLTFSAHFASVAQAEETAEANSAAVASAKAEFDERFTEYAAVLRTIEQLRTDYQSAHEARREQINELLAGELTAARKRLDAMVTAAIEYFRAAPNADPKITALLVTVARHYAVGSVVPGADSTVNGGDNYERALPIIQLLIEGGAEEKNLPVWGFVAAFVSNDFDQAEVYLKQARDAGLLVDPRSIKDPADQSVMGLALQYSVAIDKYRKLWAEERAIRATEAEADDLPRVRFSTTKGEIVLELFENEAPQTVASFLSLVKKGFYNGLTFHRVIHGFVAQGGDPKGTGTGGPGYSIRCECYEPNFRHHFRGSLSMAHSGRDTGGSQFFLTFVPTTHLDGKHTVFGRVIEGIEVLGELQKYEPGGNPSSPPPDRILKAEVLRDRGHEYTFDKLPER